MYAAETWRVGRWCRRLAGGRWHLHAGTGAQAEGARRGEEHLLLAGAVAGADGAQEAVALQQAAQLAAPQRAAGGERHLQAARLRRKARQAAADGVVHVQHLL